MNFDLDSLKSQMIRDKGFLKNLYDGSQLTNPRVIQGANDVELNTLIKVLHCITKGKIPLKKEHFETISSSKHFSILRKKFETKTSVQFLLKSPRLEKVKILKSLSGSYHHLLFALFNEHGS